MYRRSSSTRTTATNDVIAFWGRRLRRSVYNARGSAAAREQCECLVCCVIDDHRFNNCHGRRAPDAAGDLSFGIDLITHGRQDESTACYQKFPNFYLAIINEGSCDSCDWFVTVARPAPRAPETCNASASNERTN
ncbi:hypothetical protein EVAR_62005_1 [Eumeta japonica]|uniref:Uncharacterized protein n=1 Tax=Eumeta variegata TaxID=151549 RepID=A0A4C1YEQ8_EUMVA|nr:hypothetical protein EVAR_62005_1 [Eumeta japonica]